MKRRTIHVADHRGMVSAAISRVLREMNRREIVAQTIRSLVFSISALRGASFVRINSIVLAHRSS